MRFETAVLTALLVTACAREIPERPPQWLLDLPTGQAPAREQEVRVGSEKRRALLGSARYQVFLPHRSLLSFALVAVRRGDSLPRGFLRLRIRAGGRVISEHRLNPRETPRFRPVHVAFDGPGRTDLLEFEVTLETGRRTALALPEGLTLAVAEPLLLELRPLRRRSGVVFVSVDTLRRDHLGLYGYRKPTSPRLDTLGSQGLVFEDAVSVSSWTLPAHISMMTSVEPSAHGAVDNTLVFGRELPTLAGQLHRAGWLTHAITSNIWVSRESGFDEGFDNLDYSFNRKAQEVADRAVAFLEGVGERPFFLFLHFFDPHWNYDPPARMIPLFEPIPYSGALTGHWRSLKQWTPARTRPQDLAHVLALYDAEIRYTDEQLGRVLDFLRSRGLDRSTLVVVTADHGEEFLEHGRWGHERTLYEELVRIPLLLRGPAVPAAARIASQVTLLDLAPTVLDWAGLPPLPTQRGRSLLRSLADHEAYGETDRGEECPHQVFLRGGAGKWKSIVCADRETGVIRSADSYDLGADPGEARSTPPTDTTAPSFRARLLRRMADARRGARGGLPLELSREQEEQLRALGYLR